MLFETILCSVITALITTKLTYHGDTFKALRASQEKLYTEIFEKIEKLTNNRELVFEDEFINFLVETKPKVKLIASDYVVKAYVQLYELCVKRKVEYDQWHEANDPLNLLSDEDGDCLGTQTDFDRFDDKMVIYRIEHAPSPEIIGPLVKNVLNEMRFNIGNTNFKAIFQHLLKPPQK